MASPILDTGDVMLVTITAVDDLIDSKYKAFIKLMQVNKQLYLIKNNQYCVSHIDLKSSYYQ